MPYVVAEWYCVLSCFFYHFSVVQLSYAFFVLTYRILPPYKSAHLFVGEVQSSMNDLDPKQQQRPRAQTKRIAQTNELGEVATLFGVRFDTAQFDVKMDKV